MTPPRRGAPSTALRVLLGLALAVCPLSRPAFAGGEPVASLPAGGSHLTPSPEEGNDEDRAEELLAEPGGVSAARPGGRGLVCSPGAKPGPRAQSPSLPAGRAFLPRPSPADPFRNGLGCPPRC